MKKIIFLLAVLCNFSIFACDNDKELYTVQSSLQKLYGGRWIYENDELVTQHHLYKVVTKLDYNIGKSKRIISVIQRQQKDISYDCRSCEPDYFVMEIDLSKSKILYNKKLKGVFSKDETENQFELIRIKNNNYILIHQGSYFYQGILSAKISVIYQGDKILEVDPSFESNTYIDSETDKWEYQTKITYDNKVGLISFNRIGTVIDYETNNVVRMDSVETYKFVNSRLNMIVN
jgi:hypothetical protein